MAAIDFWDSTDQTGVWTLSNGDKSASVASGSGTRTVLGVGGLSTGKKYLEFVFDSGTSSPPFIREELGLTRDRPVSTSNSGATHGAGYRRGGAIVVENANVQLPDSYVAGDIVSIAADLGTGKVWFAKNGIWTQGDPGAGTGNVGTITVPGTYYPFASCDNGVSMAVTLRAVAADFSYTVPAGFEPWSGASEPVAQTTRNVGAGRSKKRTKRPKFEVEIDGQVIPVSSPSEAIEVLQAKPEPIPEIPKPKKSKPAKTITITVEHKPVQDFGGMAGQIVDGIKFDFDSAYASIDAARATIDKRRQIEEDDEDVMILLHTRKAKLDKMIDDDDEEVIIALAQRNAHLITKIQSILEAMQ